MSLPEDLKTILAMSPVKLHQPRSRPLTALDEAEYSKADKDVMLYGSGCVLLTEDGVKHIPIKDVKFSWQEYTE